MARTYEQNRSVCQYVHSTSRGHEAIQLALAIQLLPVDFVSPYYRDESLLLGLGFSPYELMLQLLARDNDPFSGGRSYYSHPSYIGSGKPTIIHQSSATGMQVIPTTGLAQGIQFLERHLPDKLVIGENGEAPVVVCSLGDASVTEGEVSEALQVAVLKQLPILYLVQDNDWGISVTASESRAMNAFDFAAGFPGLHRVQVNGSDFVASYQVLETALRYVRQERRPCLVHASVPLLGHHTSGVRMEFYRSEAELQEAQERDPLLVLQKQLLLLGISADELENIRNETEAEVSTAFEQAMSSAEPSTETLQQHVFAPGGITEERGMRHGGKPERINMVDAALYAIREIMEDDPTVLLYGQDVGLRLGGVFREAATLARQFGEHRVFNTAIQEAYIIGSTAGMSAVGLKPIVEVQFADYLYPGLNQLVSEIAKSCYLTQGKFPVRTLIRVPVGAYGGGGPYHSGSIESTLLSIKGIKVVYPSTAADMKGLMKAAFYDPNPVVMLEHKGLYWGKLPGTEGAKTPEPDATYSIPLGVGRTVIAADPEAERAGGTCCVITYGRAVYWALEAAEQLPGLVTVVDIRSLNPLDETLIYNTVKRHGKCLVLTEEQQSHSFAESLAGRIGSACFQWLDAPVKVLGALDLPAVPLNKHLEAAMLPNSDKVHAQLLSLLQF